MRQVLIFTAIILSSCASVSSSPAEKINLGMSVAEVEAVLGKPFSANKECHKYRSRGVVTTKVRYEFGRVASFNDGSC